MAGKVLHPGIAHQRKKNMRNKKPLLLSALFFLALLVFYFMVRFSGTWLVSYDELQHTPWLLVLDGQGPDMERTDYALRLLDSGLTDTILVSGRRTFKNFNNADFYRREMLLQGNYNPEQILVFHHDDASTLEEAKSIIPALIDRGVDSLTIITAPLASARALHIFRHLAGEDISYIQAANDFDFIHADNWMTHREGKALWITQILGRLYTFWELWGQNPLTSDPATSYRLGTQPASIPVTPQPTIAISDTAELPGQAADTVLSDDMDAESGVDSLGEAADQGDESADKNSEGASSIDADSVKTSVAKSEQDRAKDKADTTKKNQGE